jgi:hypothetical protein
LADDSYSLFCFWFSEKFDIIAATGKKGDMSIDWVVTRVWSLFLHWDPACDLCSSLSDHWSLTSRLDTRAMCGECSHFMIFIDHELICIRSLCVIAWDLLLKIIFDLWDNALIIFILLLKLRVTWFMREFIVFSVNFVVKLLEYTVRLCVKKMISRQLVDLLQQS